MRTDQYEFRMSFVVKDEHDELIDSGVYLLTDEMCFDLRLNYLPVRFYQLVNKTKKKKQIVLDYAIFTIQDDVLRRAGVDAPPDSSGVHLERPAPVPTDA